MESLTNISIPYSDMAILGAMLMAMIIVLIIFHVILGNIFKQLQSLSAFQDKQDQLATVSRSVRILLVVIWSVSVMALLGYGAYLIYQKIDLLEYGREWLGSIPPGYWSSLAVKFGKIIGLLIVVAVMTRGLGRFLTSLMERAKAYEQIRINNESVERFFISLNKIQRMTLWLLALVIAGGIFSISEAAQANILTALKIYLIVAIGLLIVKAMAAIVDSLDGLSRKYSRPDNFLRYYDHLRILIPLLRRSLEYIVYVGMATLVVMQLEHISWLAVYGPRIVKVIGIFFFSRVVIEVLCLLLDKGMAATDDMTPQEEQQRLTFVPLIKSIVKYLVYFLAFVLILKALEIDPTPILAGAGLMGLIVGLGAQPLINDLVAGFFILFENLYMVNDYIETGNARGIVEGIDIRTTRIRGPDGELHILRNGQIGEIINYSKKYTFAVVEVGVAYESDLDKVYRVLEEVGVQLKQDNPHVLQPTIVLGLNEFGASDLVIRTVTRVEPGRHLNIARDLRKRIKQAFDREGIEIPYARRVVILKKEGADELEAAILKQASQVSDQV